MKEKNIGIFVGSLRKASYNRAVAKYLETLAPENFKMREIDLSGLTMFNQDFDDEGTTPAAWTKFRSEVKALDGCLFVTPEYNRSFPAVLKNALDIASRPYGQNVWDGKPAGIISVSPGGMGGFGANQQLRQPLSFLNLQLLQQPEVYLGHANAFLDENGQITNDSTKAFLQQYLNAFVDWVTFLSEKH